MSFHRIYRILLLAIRQVSSQVLRLREKYILRGNIFVFIICFSKNFLGTTKIWGALTLSHPPLPTNLRSDKAELNIYQNRPHEDLKKQAGNTPGAVSLANLYLDLNDRNFSFWTIALSPSWLQQRTTVDCKHLSQCLGTKSYTSIVICRQTYLKI